VGAGQSTYTNVPWFPVPFPEYHTSVFTYDGSGHYAGTGTVNLDGWILPLTFSATYTVNPDCSCSEVLTNNWGGGSSAGVIVGVGPSQVVWAIGIGSGVTSVMEYWKQ
jgi:hypothetical protein